MVDYSKFLTHVEIFKGMLTNETIEVLCEKMYELVRSPTFNPKAISKLPPVNKERFIGIADYEAVFRELAANAETFTYLSDLEYALEFRLMYG